MTIVVCESVPTSVSGECDAVAVVNDAREELEVHLVADAGARRHHREVVERLLPPAQERVALAVAGELELDVPRERPARREQVDLHRVVDHELCRDQRVDALRIAAEVGHCVPHRGQIDDRRHAGQVLQQHARRRERDLARRLRVRVPLGDGFDVGIAAVSHHVLEQDAQRVRQARDVVRGLQLADPEDVVGRVSDGELGRRGHVVDSTRT
ncbi:MAG TPA: hypothetical protein VLK36_10835 [Gaiellaceae bacterium]|nr:hypothetical protein [Gaiellaceae bacterium]